MITSNPITPPDVLASRKRRGWKPDPQGRLLFRPRGLFGSAYVVETADQLARIERFERIKAVLLVILVGAILGSMLPMQSDDTNLAEVIGSVAVVLALVAGLVGYSLIGGSRVAAQTTMRPIP